MTSYRMYSEEEFVERSYRITVKEFLCTHPRFRCPVELSWHDLYIFHDDQTVFYVGQSNPFGTDTGAWNRVWQHLRGGFTGHSRVGEFIRHNWPESMGFEIAFWNSKASHFGDARNLPGGAEKFLIKQLSPYFNRAMARAAPRLPEKYRRPDGTATHPANIEEMIRIAGSC